MVVFSTVYHLPRFFEYVPDSDEIKQMFNETSLYGTRLTRLHKIKEYRILMLILNSTMTTLIPLIIISTFGTVLIINFVTMQHSRLIFQNSSSLERKRQAQISLATKLVIVSCVLYTITEVLSLCAIISTMIEPIFNIHDQGNPILRMTSEFNNFFLNLRESVNFLLYWMSCREYRAYFKKLFCWIRIIL